MVSSDLHRQLLVIDANNVALTPPPKGIGRPSDPAQPETPRSRKEYGEAIDWLQGHCADEAYSEQIYCLAQDDSRREVWHADQDAGLYSINTKEADPAIILLACLLNDQPIADWLKTTQGVVIPVSHFPREEFGDYAPRMAKVAMALYDQQRDILDRWKETMVGREVVVVTNDVNLREACRLAGATVDGPPVEDWYEEATDAWRRDKSSWDDSQDEGEAVSVTNEDRRLVTCPVEVLPGYGVLEGARMAGGTSWLISEDPRATNYVRLFDNRAKSRELVATVPDVAAVKVEIAELNITAAALTKRGIGLPSELVAAIEEAKQKLAAAKMVHIPGGKALFKSFLGGENRCLMFSLDDPSANTEGATVLPLWVLPVTLQGDRRIMMSDTNYFCMLPHKRGSDEAAYVVIGNRAHYRVVDANDPDGKIYGTCSAFVTPCGAIEYYKEDFGSDGLRLFTGEVETTGMAHALANASSLKGKPKGGNGEHQPVETESVDDMGDSKSDPPTVTLTTGDESVPQDTTPETAVSETAAAEIEVAPVGASVGGDGVGE